MTETHYNDTCGIPRLIGLSGGIGSGKSVVARILRLRGYSVYDCDMEARNIMQSSSGIRESLVNRWGDSIIGASGTIDRRAIAGRIFSDETERLWLNKLVHGAVRADLRSWRSGCGKDQAGPVFVESAILYESEIWRECSDVWMVTAPEETRISRIMARSGMSREEAKARIESQHDEEAKLCGSGIPIHDICNDGDTSLLLQTEELLKGMEEEIITKM